MLQSGRLFTFSGPDALQKLKDEVAVRLEVVKVANNQPIAFGIGHNQQNNPVYWTSDWHVQQGHTAEEAILDAMNHPNLYATGCTYAAALNMLGGILLWHKSHDAPSAYQTYILQFNRLLGDDPLNNYLRVLGEGDTPVVARDDGVAWHNWIPGDWGWIMNVGGYWFGQPTSGGFGGKNITYVGMGMFSGGYSGSGKYTMQKAVADVLSWQQPKPLNVLSDPLKEHTAHPTKMSGGLRDVRDYPAIW